MKNKGSDRIFIVAAVALLVTVIYAILRKGK